MTGETLRHSQDPFLNQVIAEIPRLRAYAIGLSGSVQEADDLVQETLLRAIKFRGKYEAGTRLRAWLFTILRNHFLNQAVRGRRIKQDVDGALAAKVSIPAAQEWAIQHRELLVALQQLTPEHREVLTLFASGVPYEEMAELAGCAMGTIKSRVNRARQNLQRILDGDADDNPPAARLKRKSPPALDNRTSQAGPADLLRGTADPAPPWRSQARHWDTPADRDAAGGVRENHPVSAGK